MNNISIYRKSQKLFRRTFLWSVSIFLIVVSVIEFTREPTLIRPDCPSGNLCVNIPESDANNNSLLTLITLVSLLTSIGSLLGFISTTILAWRKEKRDKISFDIENQKKILENEKLILEGKKLTLDIEEIKNSKSKEKLSRKLSKS